MYLRVCIYYIHSFIGTSKSAIDNNEPSTSKTHGIQFDLMITNNLCLYQRWLLSYICNKIIFPAPPLEHTPSEASTTDMDYSDDDDDDDDEVFLPGITW